MNGGNGLRDAYRGRLRKHAHMLIGMGYRQLSAEAYASSEEPAITGELVRGIREVLECDSSPPWVEHYSIHDDPPLNVPGQHGRSRPRVDIEFERVNRGPRPRLRFEAKRLGKRHGVGPYLGADGLGCFTSGRYPLTHPEAGMIGYIQSDDESAWAAKIEAALRQDPVRYATTDNNVWAYYWITSQLTHTYRSQHRCQVLQEDMQIFHTLLLFS